MRSDEILGFLGTLLMPVLYLSLILFVVLRARRSRAAVQRGEGLEEIALALGGEVTKDAAFDEPVVRFSVDGIPSYCRRWNLFEGKPDVVTTFECRTGFGGFFEATSLRALRYPSRSPRFRVLPQESGFQLVTTDPDWAVELLDRGLRQILRDSSGWWRRARITLAPDRFLVEFESRLTPGRSVEVAQLVARVAALSRPSAHSAGVTFLDGVQVGAGRCPVCGQTFDLPKVQCAQCKVPHHSDCWAYWGRCAIFGCRSVRSA